MHRVLPPAAAALDIANAYLDASPINPTGSNDVAEFGDQMTASCQTATSSTKIFDLRSRAVSVFVAQHPADAVD